MKLMLTSDRYNTISSERSHNNHKCGKARVLYGLAFINMSNRKEIGVFENPFLLCRELLGLLERTERLW
jgi:hypothetical protein